MGTGCVAVEAQVVESLVVGGAGSGEDMVGVDAGFGARE